MSTDRGIGWAAGLYEGEGSLSMAWRGYPRVALGMTDREPVEWSKDVLGFGSIHTRHYEGRKDMHRFECDGWVHVQQVYEWFRPYLSPRRLARFEEILAKRPVVPASPPCAEPSPAAYRRHLRRNEPPCTQCRQQNTNYERARREGRQPRYPDGRGYTATKTARTTDTGAMS